MTSTETVAGGVRVLPKRLARSWSPAQLVAPTIGFVFILWGLISIGHSGFHPERIFQPHDALVGLHYTPFLAALEVGFGLTILIGGALIRAARTPIRTVNSLAVGLGIVVLTLAGAAALGLGIAILADAWPAQLHHWLNTDRRDGVLYVVAGAVALGAAVAAPFVLTTMASARPAEEPRELSPPPEPEPKAALDSPEPEPGLVPASDASSIA